MRLPRLWTRAPATDDFQPGDRVAFTPDSFVYAEGYRSGTVVSTDSTVREHLQRQAERFGPEVLALPVPPEDLCLVLPVVRVDPSVQQPLPLALELAVRPQHLTPLAAGGQDFN